MTKYIIILLTARTNAAQTLLGGGLTALKQPDPILFIDSANISSDASEKNLLQLQDHVAFGIFLPDGATRDGIGLMQGFESMSPSASDKIS